MPSSENQERPASTTNHQNGDGPPNFSHSRDTSKSGTGGRGKSSYGGKGSWRGQGSGGNLGDRRGRTSRGGSNRKKDIGRGEWAYANQTASPSPYKLIDEAVIQLIEERITTSEMQNDKN